MGNRILCVECHKPHLSISNRFRDRQFLIEGGRGGEKGRDPSQQRQNRDRRTKIAGDMCFDVLFHMRLISTPNNVLPLLLLGVQTPPYFIFFKFTKKLLRGQKIRRNKSCRTQKDNCRQFLFQSNICSNNELMIFQNFCLRRK